MFAVASKPKIYSLGQIFPSPAGSTFDNGGGKIIYLDASNRHGWAVSLKYWASTYTWNEVIATDNTFDDNWGPWRVPSESEFNTYVRPMWNGTATDYLPWNQGSWPSSNVGQCDSIYLRDVVNATEGRRYITGTDSFGNWYKTNAGTACKFWIREF